MKLKTLFIGAIFGLSSMTLMAGSGHNHGHSHAPTVVVSESGAIENATKIVASLIKKNKLEQSWSSVKASSAEKTAVDYRPEWRITFINNNIEDINKQKLYVFLSLDGLYIAANFTGK